MLTLSLVGIGCGDPAHLTRKAVDAINAADLILIPRKGEEKSELADLRRQICADVLYLLRAVQGHDQLVSTTTQWAHVHGHQL